MDDSPSCFTVNAPFFVFFFYYYSGGKCQVANTTPDSCACALHTKLVVDGEEEQPGDSWRGGGKQIELGMKQVSKGEGLPLPASIPAELQTGRHGSSSGHLSHSLLGSRTQLPVLGLWLLEFSDHVLTKTFGAAEDTLEVGWGEPGAAGSSVMGLQTGQAGAQDSGLGRPGTLMMEGGELASSLFPILRPKPDKGLS